jgi:predicted dehydrogenase/acetyltransferase-like isoleucine patch superfamily enzyme
MVLSGVMNPSVAVIGCGYWGRNLVRVFAEIGALAAVCDADTDVAAEHAETHGVAARGLDEILADDSIPAVAIAAPAAQHGDLAGRALRADKHVFVEKPIALRATDAEELIAQAGEQGRVLMVGHLLQYHPGFLALRELIAAGRLGRLQYIYSNRLNLGKIRREENVFWSFAPHDISMILALAGEMPSSVSAKGASYLHNVIADVTNTYLSFPSGINAHIFVSWLHPYKDQKLVVVGSEGMAVFDDTKAWGEKLRLYAHRIGWKDGAPEPERAEAELIELQEGEPLRLECEHFVACVETGATPRTDGHEGLRVLRVLEAAEASLLAERTGAAGAMAAPASVGAASGPVSAGWAGARPQRGSSAATGPAAPGGATGDASAFPDAFVHESSYVDEGCTIGPGTKIWHFSHILSDSHIGAGCIIGQNVMIGPAVTVGDRCKIQNNVSLYKGVTLEEGVFCGPSCVFTNVLNPRAEIERKDEFRSTRVGKGATIGANATIICGNDLGDYSFIAAGAIVTHDVPAHALVAGIPAQRIGWMSPAGERLGDDLVCPRTGRRFEERDGELVEVQASSSPAVTAKLSGEADE